MIIGKLGPSLVFKRMVTKRKADLKVGLKSFGRGCLKGRAAYDGAAGRLQLRVLHMLISGVHASLAWVVMDTLAAEP
ncbi:hypothetical protein AB3M93_17615 [Novosphingobium panipatense]|uniref:hypothetical protein n=1 Tax=Novosphingobium panipatense TaxID=428991 RepID=UPI0039A03EEA